MKTYRFVTTTYHDVQAETLEKAIDAFNEMKRGEISTQLGIVSRIEVKDEKGNSVPVDRPLRGGDLDARQEAQIHLLA